MINKVSQCVGRSFVKASVVASLLVATAFAQEDDIVGNWECDLTVEDPASGAKVDANFEMTYNADGSYTRDGDISIVIEAFQLDISVSQKEAGNWRLVDSTGLAETLTEIDLSSSSETPSQMEQMMVGEMQAQAAEGISQEEITEIRSLTGTTMELEDDDGATVSCAKA